ncbi:hypothetical protein BH11CYA1_BH11CYA1_24860 [soil metagenome]
MLQLLAALGKQSPKTTHRGLSQQFTKDLLVLVPGQKNGTASMAQKRSARGFLERLALLEPGHLEYIDIFIEAINEYNDELIAHLVGEYKECPEGMVEMVDFINIEIHRRNIQHRTQLSAVMVRDNSAEKFTVVYLYAGWSRSGKPRWPRHFRTDHLIG